MERSPGNEAAAAGGKGCSIAGHLHEARLPAGLEANDAGLAQRVCKAVEHDTSGWLTIPACSACTNQRT